MIVYWFYPLVGALGAFASFINAMAGGAHMFSLPVLGALGVDTVDANNSAKVCSFFTSLLGVYALRNVSGINRHTLMALFLFCVPGSMLGTYFSMTISRKLYAKLLYCTMFLVSTYLLIKSRTADLEKFSGEEARKTEEANFSPYSIKFALVNFIFSTYVGFMFIGAGVLMFYIYVGVMRFSLAKVNGMKFLVVTFTTGISVLSLSLAGGCDWKLTGSMSLGGLVGSALGMLVQLYVKGAEKWVAKVVTLMALSLSIKIILDLLQINLV